MKRVIFYIEPDWAFGSIHHELSKYLWSRGYNCLLMPWNRAYTSQEIHELNDHIDFWVTTHYGALFLENSYGVTNLDKIIVVAHAASDLDQFLEAKQRKNIHSYRNYGVVSQFLKKYSSELGLERIPLVCPVGINYNTYFSQPSSGLKIVGYAGAGMYELTEEQLKTPDNYWIKIREIKRAYLIKEAVQKAGLELKVAQQYHNSFVTMGSFYKTVDCIISSSIKEGAGLPVLEAGAAGKLVLSTPVGHWNQLVGSNGGIEMPLPENEFVEKCTEVLLFYKNNPNEYRNRCAQIQEHAKSYDWSNRIDSWIELFK